MEAQLLKSKASLLQAKQNRTQALQAEEQADGQVYSAKTQQVQAQQNLDKLESQPAATTPNHANDVTIAERQLKSGEARCRDGPSRARSRSGQGVQTANANLKSAQKSYGDAVADTKHTVVTAPITGVITALPISVGSQVAAGSTSSASSGGSSASSGGGGEPQDVAWRHVPGTSSASCELRQCDHHLRHVLDQGADSGERSRHHNGRSRAERGRELRLHLRSQVFYNGKVGGGFAHGTTTSGVVNYTVDIDLDTLDPSLRPDMTATADIKTLVAQSVLVVPNIASINEGSTKYVNVVAADSRDQEADGHGRRQR